MIIAFARKGNEYICKNVETNRTITVSTSELLSKSIVVDNLKVINDKVTGNKFDVTRLPEHDSPFGRCYIFKVKLSPDGNDILGYYYITYNGELKYTDKESLQCFRKYGIANAYLVEDKLDIKNINTLEFEKAFKAISYSSDDYYNLYKQYSKQSLIASSGKVVDNYENALIKRNYAQSLPDSFMEGHKIINQILLKSTITRLVKIYTKMQCNSNKVEAVNNETNFLYKVTFIYRNTKNSLLILRTDKKLLNVLKSKNVKLSKTTKSDIIDLVLNNNIDNKFTSTTTLAHALDNESNNKDIKDKLAAKCNIVIDNNKLILNNKEYNFRKNIMIGSSDYTLLQYAV